MADIVPGAKQMPEKLDPIEHQNIPQAHQGLHDFLYSSADEHSPDTAPVSMSKGAVNTPLAIEAWCSETQNIKIAGVYAVLDCNGETQFIGYSRDVELSLRSHQTQKGAETCAMVTVQSFKFPKRAEMEQLRDQWIADLPSPPPGNLDKTWAGTVKEAATQVMSAAEREAYEEKKLKLRRAMADASLHSEDKQSQSKLGSPQDLAAATDNDNWSAVVREQTKETQA